jgi:ceramide glucosyltransferase
VAITTILCVLTLLSALVTLGMHIAAHVLFARSKRLPRGTRPISILRPLKGNIESLEENLESLCRQNHGTFEILVGAADPADPSLTVARRVRDKYPNVAVRIITGQWPTGLNPKVRLLRQLLEHAQYKSVLISDDNVRVRPDYLSVMAGALKDPRVGLVSNLVVGVGGRTLGAKCENLQLNTFVLGAVAASYWFGYPVVVGKSMLFRGGALKKAGGLANVADVLAEDHLLGRAVHAAGYRVKTLGHPVHTVNVDWTLTRTFERHLRWSKMRSNLAPWVFPFELLLQPLAWGVLSAVAAALFGMPISPAWLDAVGLALMGNAVSEVALLRRAQGTHFRLSDSLLLPLRNLIAVAAHVGSGFVTTVRWRAEAYRMGRDSRLLPLASPRRFEPRMPFRRAA